MFTYFFCGMFSIRVSDDYSPAISKKQSELVLDELGSGVDQCGARICGFMSFMCVFRCFLCLDIG